MTDDSRWTEPCVLLGSAWLSDHRWKGLSQTPSHDLSRQEIAVVSLFVCFFLLLSLIVQGEGFAVIYVI